MDTRKGMARVGHYQHLSLLQKLWFSVTWLFSLAACDEDSFALGSERAAVRYGWAPGASSPAAASRRASTTRRTSTMAVSIFGTSFEVGTYAQTSPRC
jgi:hypothetical protein